MNTTAQLRQASRAHEADDKTVFGFWVYLMTDCLLFAALFATYAVMQGSSFGGPSGRELFSLPYVYLETLLLLTSSFSCGLGSLNFAQRRPRRALAWFGLTFVLGAAFLLLELLEFQHLVVEGNSWSRNGFLSAYFTLVGTHGLHIAVGLLWLLVMGVQTMRRGLHRQLARQWQLFGLFWHFLDIIWVFIFTVVYLAGVL